MPENLSFQVIVSVEVNTVPLSPTITNTLFAYTESKKRTFAKDALASHEIASFDVCYLPLHLLMTQLRRRTNSDHVGLVRGPLAVEGQEHQQHWCLLN